MRQGLRASGLKGFEPYYCYDSTLFYFYEAQEPNTLKIHKTYKALCTITA